MKYIKQYENLDTDLKVGDYVLFYFRKFNLEKGGFVTRTNIGKIVEINDQKDRNKYLILSNKKNSLHKNGLWNVDISEIERNISSKQIEEFETELRANKYNL